MGLRRKHAVVLLVLLMLGAVVAVQAGPTLKLAQQADAEASSFIDRGLEPQYRPAIVNLGITRIDLGDRGTQTIFSQEWVQDRTFVSTAIVYQNGQEGPVLEERNLILIDRPVAPSQATNYSRIRDSVSFYTSGVYEERGLTCFRTGPNRTQAVCKDYWYDNGTARGITALGTGNKIQIHLCERTTNDDKFGVEACTLSNPRR